TQAYNDATSNIKSLNGVLNDLNEGKGLTADKIGLILDKYPHLLAYLDDETTLRREIQREIENETQVALEAIQQKLMEEDSYIKSAKVLNSDFRKWLINQYDIDLVNYKNLAKAKE